MLLTISTTLDPATDLGYLLHKHPDRVQEFRQSAGVAQVFYPQASHERCTAALLLEVDPIRLVRSRGQQSPDFSLGQYVNDRPYAASSLLAVALGDVFRTARTGRCAARPELAAARIPLTITLPALPCRRRSGAWRPPLGAGGMWVLMDRARRRTENAARSAMRRHLELISRLAAADTSGLLMPTRHLAVRPGDPASEAAAIEWWSTLTAAGGEGIVVKPGASLVRGAHGLVQPGIKVRSREYLLGLEALSRLAEGEPLWRIHEPVFAVLALDSEPVDPRL